MKNSIKKIDDYLMDFFYILIRWGLVLIGYLLAIILPITIIGFMLPVEIIQFFEGNNSGVGWDILILIAAIIIGRALIKMGISSEEKWREAKKYTQSVDGLKGYKKE